MLPEYSHAPTLASSMASLFEGHQLALQYLVPNLLQLYVDIEFTGAHTQVLKILISSPASFLQRFLFHVLFSDRLDVSICGILHPRV